MEKTQKKPAYKGFTTKEKILPVIMLSLIAPFMVCFFGPFEIFGNNIDQFKFALGDFWLLCIVIAAAIAAVVGVVLMLLRGRAFDVAYGLMFGISFMLFLQGNFLSMGMTSLEGDGAADALGFGKIFVNTAIWLLVIGGSIAVMLLLDKYRDTVRLISIVALVAVLGSSLISFATLSLTTDVYGEKSMVSMTEGEQVLTVKNLDTLAKEQNVIVFIVDRFDYEYYDVALRDCPEIFDELEGFTYFADYITKYPRTFPGALHVMTGVETDFTMSHDEYMTHAYKNSDHLMDIKNNGFDVNIYTDDYYCYEDAGDMSGYAENLSGKVSYRILQSASLSIDMIRLSLYRYLPFCAQGLVGNISTPTFDKYVEYDMTYDIFSTDMKKTYGVLTEDEFTLRESDKGYSFIHVDGCHKSTIYDSDFNELPENDPQGLRNSTVNVMTQSFKVISRYIAEMKRLGVYEDATIIITGDHASIGSDTKMPSYAYVTALFVKPAGVSTGKTVNNYAQLDVDNVLATIKEACGIATDIPTVFEVSESEEQVRTHLFQRAYKNEAGKTVYENIEYEIRGNGKDFSNWVIVSRTELGKSIYD
ncbi:MAG: hypothetical protein IIU63_07465 [Clostridia bacterium]|nr:hypothetical protein [Clostridia bacterium]